MRNKWILPAIAILAILFTGYHLAISNTERPMEPPPVAPAQSPFGQTVAGAGIVEAKTENISIGTHVPGIVMEKYVEVGQKVNPGDILFKIDNRSLMADLRVKEAQLGAAEAKLKRLKSMPRPEEIPPSEAKVKRMQAEFQAARDVLERGERLFTSRSMGEEELIKRRQAAAAAQEGLKQAEAEDALLKKGAWESDIQVAEAEVLQAQNFVDQAKTELSRLEVCSPIAGEVLQVNVRAGEYVGTPPNQPLIVLGNMQNLRVRVDIDESDIPDYRPGMIGRAFVRGDSDKPIPLRFVRVEPFVVPKKSLTRAAGEHVDTRVLQVIYEMDATKLPIFVGQQLDVFFDRNESPATTTPSVAEGTKVATEE